MEDVLVPLAMFATVVIVIYIIFNARNKERLALIESGANANIFFGKNRTSLFVLKAGIFLVGLAIGILFGHLLASKAGLMEEVAYFSMILLFGGIGLIISHVIGYKIRKEEDQSAGHTN